MAEVHADVVEYRNAAIKWLGGIIDYRNLGALLHPRFSEVNSFHELLLESGSESGGGACSGKLISRVSKEMQSIQYAAFSDSGVRKVLLSKLQENSESNQTMRYSATRFHKGKRVAVGGLSDRIRGLSTVMLLAIATNRRFEIDWEFPFPFNEIYKFRDYKWLPREDVVGKNIDLVDKNFKEIRKEIDSKDIVELLGIDADCVSVNCNSPELRIFHNSAMEEVMAELGRRPTLVEVIGTALSLFDYWPSIEEATIGSVFLSVKDCFSGAIGIQFRTGGDGHWRDPSLDSVDNLGKLFQVAIDGKSDSELADTMVYFTTDSESARDAAIRDYDGHLNLVTANLPIVHMDRSSGPGIVRASRLAILENHLLSCCEEITSGRGGFGRLAAKRNFKKARRYRLLVDL